MKICPECGDTDVIVYSIYTDHCNGCNKTFPEVEDQKTVYCHECSKAGGAERAIYHLPPVCPKF